MASGFAYELRKAAFDDWTDWQAASHPVRQTMRVHYRRGVGLHGQQPWCAAAVSDWIQRAVVTADRRFPVNLRSAGAKALIHLLLKAGWQRIDNPAELQPSDAVCWHRGKTDDDYEGHIGIVLNTADGVVTTIEGNSGNALRKKHYQASRFGRFYVAARPPAT